MLLEARRLEQARLLSRVIAAMVQLSMPTDGRKQFEELTVSDLLDASTRASLEDQVDLAARFFRVPMALISFFEPELKGLETHVGLASDYAAHVLSLRTRAGRDTDQVFTIEDVAREECFANDPMVVGEPHIRFFASAPICTMDGTGGTSVGVMFVIDIEPRTLDEDGVDVLRLMARQVGTLLALRERSAEAERLATERDAVVLESIQARRRSDELLELVLRGGDLGLWDLQPQTGRWTINSREREMLGYGPEIESDSLDWDSLIHPEDLRVQRAAFVDHLQHRTPFAESTYRLRSRSGSWISVLDRSVIVERDIAGRAKRVVGTHMDVTAQRARDVERIRATERLELAVSAGALGLWDLDVPAGRAVYSDRWWALMGYAPDEIDVVEGFWKSLVHPEDEAGARQGLARHLVGTTPLYDREVRMRHKDGHYLWIHDRANVVERDDTGNAQRVIGVSRDISIQKKTEAALIGERHRLQMITDNMPALITHVDREERYTFVNAHHERVFGVRAASLIGKTMREVCGEAVYSTIAPHIARALTGETVRFEDAGPARGIVIHYESHYVPDFDANDDVVGFYSMVFDINDLKRAEHALHEQQTRLRGITDNLPALIAELDHESRFTFCNATYRDWLGLDPEVMVGKRIIDAVDPKFYGPRQTQIARAYAGERVVFEQLVELPVGERWLQTTYIPQSRSDGSVEGIYALTSDISELKDVQRRLDALAREDPLTGLPNRRVFEEHLDGAIARCRRTGSVIAVLYIDIDRFKDINDTGGHAVGDAVLKEFGSRLLHCVRTTDTVARFGGDEFLVLLDALEDLEGAPSVAQKILAAMTVDIMTFEQPFAVTASIGVAMHRGDDQTAEALVSAADGALYSAKSAGRNQFCVAPS